LTTQREALQQIQDREKLNLYVEEIFTRRNKKGNTISLYVGISFIFLCRRIFARWKKKENTISLYVEDKFYLFTYMEEFLHGVNEN
jgi:hypothetical protein